MNGVNNETKLQNLIDAIDELMISVNTLKDSIEPTLVERKKVINSIGDIYDGLDIVKRQAVDAQDERFEMKERISILEQRLDDVIMVLEEIPSKKTTIEA